MTYADMYLVGMTLFYISTAILVIGVFITKE